MILGSLVLANLKMLFRNRQSLFWALAFPLLFVGIFGLFNLDQTTTTTIGVVDRSQDDVSRALIQSLDAINTFKVENRDDEDDARKDLKDGDLNFLIVIPGGLGRSVADGDPASIGLTYDERSPTSAVVIGIIQRFLGEVNLNLVEAPSLLNLSAQGVRARDLDYFDFLLPGFVGMGVMTYAIIGLGAVMTTYREQKILKRIQATPLRVRTFFGGLILAHLMLALVQTALILAAGILILDGDILGNYAYIGILVVMGNTVFLSIGFIVGSIAKNAAAASGLGNAVAMPMMFLSGVFFPTDDLPGFLPTVVSYLPLAPMLEAMRGVALDAEPLWAFPTELAILGGWVILAAAVAIKSFKFG